METPDYKNLMQELQERNASLTDALAMQERLNQELVAVNERLRESEAMKSHFLSNISNEIVNPFTAITGLARSIIGKTEQDYEAVRKMTSLILTEALHLDFQLKNIFMAAAIEAGEVAPSFYPADLSAIIRQVVTAYELDIARKSIRIRMNLPENQHLVTDPEKFELIFLNLFNNALLFTAEGTEICLSLSETDEGLVLEVEDQGPGINPDELTRIFDRFKRLENKINSINRGNGLGLCVIRSLTELMNGRMEVESEPGNGSVFKIFLPKPADEMVHATAFSNAGNELFFKDEMIF